MRVSTFLPGFLAFLGYYDLLSALTIPFRFTVDRVTNTYLVRAPLLGGLEVDFLAYAIAASLMARQENERRLRLTYLLAITTSATTLLLCRFLELEWPVYLALGASALFSAAIPTLKRGPSTLLPGILLSTTLLEASTLLALSTYYIFGGWRLIPFQVVLRERVVWSPLEWASPVLLIAGMWIALIGGFLRRPIPQFFKSPSRVAREDESGSIWLLALALIFTTLMVVLPHLPTVNMEFKPVSVDTALYKILFARAGDGGFMAMLGISPERPVFIFIAYHLWRMLSGDTVLLMDLVYPLIALTTLSAASYYAGLRLGGSSTAGWASLLVPLGYAVPAFIGGGFQANSLALTPAILALTIEARSPRDALKLSLLLSLTALLHPWTYSMYSAALILRALRDRRQLQSTAMAVILSYIASQAVDYQLGRVFLAETAARPVAGSWGLHLPTSWFEAVQFYVWNTLSNPLHLTLSAIDTSGVMAASAPLTIILPRSLIYRLILNIPTQLQAPKTIKNLKREWRGIILLTLLVRTLGNLTGLTPLEEPWWPT
jgi:hypothetical protein